VNGHIEPDEMCHERCLLVHSSLYLTIVKEWWKDRLWKVTTKNIFFFCSLKSKRTLSKPINSDYFRWTFLQKESISETFKGQVFEIKLSSLNVVLFHDVFSRRNTDYTIRSSGITHVLRYTDSVPYLDHQSLSQNYYIWVLSVSSHPSVWYTP